MWTLHVTKGLTQPEMNALLSHENEYVRSWALQLMTEDKSISDETLKQFVSIAQNDNSPLVRLYLTSALLRISPEQRWEAVEALVQKTSDKDDHNIPLMLWYAAEPLATLDAKRALALAEKSMMDKHLEFMVRRISALNTNDSRSLLTNLKSRLEKEHNRQSHEVIMAIDEGMKGMKK